MLIGIWKSYEELEDNLSMPELTEILVTHSNVNYEHRKFLAALKGIDLDNQSGSNNSNRNEWEDLKARVFSGGQVSNSDDVLSLQGSVTATPSVGSLLATNASLVAVRIQ